MGPDDIDDEDFGKLTWDRRINCWVGQSAMVDGTPFSLMIETMSYLRDVPGPGADATWDRTIAKKSREALSRIQSSDAAFRDAAARKFLRDFQQWSQDPNVDKQTFERRLKLESVVVLPTGGASISYDDDGMFGGHALIVHMDPDGWLSRVEQFG